MTKDEIALQLTLASVNKLNIASSVEELSQNIYEFYNSVFDNVKTEYSVKRDKGVNVLK